jgi:hypothetical protein
MGKGKRFSGLFLTVASVLLFATAASAHSGISMLNPKNFYKFNDSGLSQIWITKAFRTPNGAVDITTDLEAFHRTGCHAPKYWVGVQEHKASGWTSVFRRKDPHKGLLGYYGTVHLNNGTVEDVRSTHNWYDYEIDKGHTYRLYIATFDSVDKNGSHGGNDMLCYDNANPPGSWLTIDRNKSGD